MNVLNITIENGLAVKHNDKVDGCLNTQAQIAKAIKDMSGAELTNFYKSLTGKEVKRFSSKDNAAKRIFKFINPKGIMPKRPAKAKPAKKKAAAKAKPAGEKKTVGSKSKVRAQTINILEHEKKTFQSGSMRGQVYNVIMDNAKSNKLTVEKFLTEVVKIKVGDNLITEAQALGCLKKLCEANQKVQTMELVD